MNIRKLMLLCILSSVVSGSFAAAVPSALIPPKQEAQAAPPTAGQAAPSKPADIPLVESKSVTVNGLNFRLSTPKIWAFPAFAAPTLSAQNSPQVSQPKISQPQASFAVSLIVINRGKAAVKISPQQALRFTLAAEKGQPLTLNDVKGAPPIGAPVTYTILRGQSLKLSLGGTLARTGNETFRLTLTDGKEAWTTEGVRPGKQALQLSYPFLLTTLRDNRTQAAVATLPALSWEIQDAPPAAPGKTGR